MYQTCKSILHYNESECIKLGTKMDTNVTRHIESQAQAYVSDIQRYKQGLEIFIPALIALNLGPWSDVHGRRPLLVVSFIGKIFLF